MNRGVFMTKAQIQAEIDDLNWERRNCNSEIRQYSNALGYARSLLKKLQDGTKYLNTSKDNLNRYFTINGKTADSGSINATINELNDAYRVINSTIIPNINSKIRSLNNEIDDIDNRISYLRREYAKAQA